jgi:hypothetical protein
MHLWWVEFDAGHNPLLARLPSIGEKRGLERWGQPLAIGLSRGCTIEGGEQQRAEGSIVVTGNPSAVFD